MRILSLLLFGLFLSLGCRPAAPGGGGPPAPRAEQADAPKGEAIADPVLREAREQADAILDGLLAGKFDNGVGLGVLARKLKGYQSYPIKSQKLNAEGAAEIRGIFRDAEGKDQFFNMILVKQAGGKWAVGTLGLSGPNAE